MPTLWLPTFIIIVSMLGDSQKVFTFHFATSCQNVKALIGENLPRTTILDMPRNGWKAEFNMPAM